MLRYAAAVKNRKGGNNLKFTTPDLSDKRISFAAEYLEGMGIMRVEKAENADFILLGVNPDKGFLGSTLPVFAGNVRADNVFDYTKSEVFAQKNAFLTAEGAVSLAIEKSSFSLIDSSVLITGYGRIAKALHFYLTPFTKRITVAARSEAARITAQCFGAAAISIDDIREKAEYNYIFNTVPHPIFGNAELSQISRNALLIDLASFPGGVDKGYAKVKGINLITARGLPSVYSPEAAGKAVGETVYNMLKEVIV